MGSWFGKKCSRLVTTRLLATKSVIASSVLAPFMIAPSLQAAPEVLETLLVSGVRTGTSGLHDRVMLKTDENFMPGARLDPAELLQHFPGVQVDSRSNYAQDTRISLRGFGARSAFGVRGIDLLVDGVPLSTPDGQGQLSSSLLDSIGRVEVLRGPIAALYGNGAGGVIALQTAVPEYNNISASVMAGDPGLQRQLLQGEWQRNNLAARVQFANTDIDGERPHSRAERKQAGAQIFYRTDSGIDVLVKHDYSDDPLLQDPLGLTPAQWRNDPWQLNPAAETFDTRKSVAHQQTSISLRDNTGSRRWQASLWQGERDIVQYLGFSGDAITGSGGVVDLARDFSGASGTFTQSLDVLAMPVDISVGAELAQMQDHRRGYVNNNGEAGDLRRNDKGDLDSRDIYALVQMHPLETLMLYAGARHTSLDIDVQDFFIVSSPTGAVGNPDDSGARNYREQAYAIGVNYTFVNAWEIFASSGRGYETPTLTEMAYKTNATGLNTELDAAINRQHEWGIRYRPRALGEITLTQFLIETENEIVVDQSLNGRTSFRNAAATERDGIELLVRYPLGEQILVQFSAQQLDAEYSAGQWQGKTLPGVAARQYQLGVQWRPWVNDALIAGLQAQERARIFTADNNQIYAPAYTTFDFTLQGVYSLQQVSLPKTDIEWWIKLANITDENYVGSVVVNQSNGRAFEPALGRNLVAGIKLGYKF
ncbi:TonB-dependent receptor domain-containing protein [Cellvibrio sp. pealriver]|uniref:TonB-dependent receptor family protein n=1 Tax=Cellvibrio sp. pealriver TaxID=1622269 RepID=UPI001E489FA5|nr:TonB-dependent receptor [Cellvibrio sp. pealriver]